VTCAKETNLALYAIWPFGKIKMACKFGTFLVALISIFPASRTLPVNKCSVFLHHNVDS